MIGKKQFFQLGYEAKKGVPWHSVRFGLPMGIRCQVKVLLWCAAESPFHLSNFFSGRITDTWPPRVQASRRSPSSLASLGMAEVVGMLGLIASILGVLEGIDKSKSVIKKYVHSSASLRAELVPLLGKLTAFAGILRGLQLECELDESDNGRLQIFAHIRDPLEASKKAAQTIMTRLDQVVSVGGITLSFGKVLNKETSAALHILDQTKSVLELALTADQRFVYHFVSPRS